MRREKKEKKGKAKAKARNDDFVVSDDSDAPVTARSKGNNKSKPKKRTSLAGT